VLRLLPPGRPVPPAGDGAVGGHKGKRVHGKARHRDPVRSAHSYTAGRYGHRRLTGSALGRRTSD
jgi:hypothetical protein